MSSELIKLTALDADDLQVVSTHLQDAIIRVGDLKFLPAEKRFAAIVNRFDWLAKERAGETGDFQRRSAGLRFDRVNRVSAQKIRQGVDDAVLELLSVEFTPTQEPSGTIVLHFAGGGAIRLDVECIEAGLADLGPVWETARAPDHDLDTADEPAGSGEQAPEGASEKAS